MKHTVFVDDHARYMDEDARRAAGEYDRGEDAVAACKAIVDRSLSEQLRPGMTAEQLMRHYMSFG